jgi:L-threonylcarbamoyladenylate synthase
MVAVRMPDHPVASALLTRAGCPIAAPSANRFGRPSPTAAQAVQDDLGDAVDLILDGGPPRVGIESTVVAFDGEQPILLRPGGVTLESLERVVGRVAIGQPRAGVSASPGMLTRHYAPRTPLYLLASGGASTALRHEKIGLLSFFAPQRLPIPIAETIVLGRDGRLETAAAEFFQALRQLDAAGLDAIVASPVEESGLGRALMDRLRRAASGWAWIEDGHLAFAQRGEGA